MLHIFIRELNISPPIWQSYINAILDCLQSREYFKAIMDDLFMFTPTKNHTWQNFDIFKGFTQEWIENITQEMLAF